MFYWSPQMEPLGVLFPHLYVSVWLHVYRFLLAGWWIRSVDSLCAASDTGARTPSLATFLADCVLLSLSSFSALLAASKT